MANLAKGPVKFTDCDLVPNVFVTSRVAMAPAVPATNNTASVLPSRNTTRTISGTEAAAPNMIWAA